MLFCDGVVGHAKRWRCGCTLVIFDVALIMVVKNPKTPPRTSRLRCLAVVLIAPWRVANDTLLEQSGELAFAG